MAKQHMHPLNLEELTNILVLNRNTQLVNPHSLCLLFHVCSHVHFFFFLVKEND